MENTEQVFSSATRHPYCLSLKPSCHLPSITTHPSCLSQVSSDQRRISDVETGNFFRKYYLHESSYNCQQMSWKTPWYTGQTRWRCEKQTIFAKTSFSRLEMKKVLEGNEMEKEALRLLSWPERKKFCFKSRTGSGSNMIDGFQYSPVNDPLCVGVPLCVSNYEPNM